MLRRVLISVLCCLTILSVWLHGAASPGAEPARFRQEIAPLLVRRCLACHGEQKFKGEYQLHTLTSLLKPGASGEMPVVPGRPDTSYLLKLVRETDPEQRMPKNANKLTDADIALLERWIADGAKSDGASADATLVNVAQWQHPRAPETYRRPFPITALAIAPQGQELAVGGYHEVTIWNLETGLLARRLAGLSERTYALSYTRDGSQLVVAGGTPGQLGEVRILNAADGALVRHVGSYTDCAFAAALSPDEQRLAVAGADQLARLYDLSSGKELTTIKDHSDWIMALAWSPDGSRLATASRDKTCKVFDTTNGALVTTFAEHGEPIFGIAYSNDGKHAISAGADKRIRYWIADDPGWENAEKMDKKKRHQVGEITGLTAAVQALIAVDGRLFACTADRGVRQFDLEKRSAVRAFAGHQELPLAASYHAGTKRLATAGFDGEVRIWQTDAKDDKAVAVATFFAAPGYQPPAPATTASTN